MNDEPVSAMVQRLASHELERTSESRRTIIEEHSAAFRWLLASLLAVNGGALVFSKELFATGEALPLVAGALFLIGIMGALLTGWFSQRANRKMIEPLSEMTAFWIQCVETGELDEQQFKALIDKTQRAVNSARPTQFCGWVSALSFFVGSIILGASFVT